MKPRIELIAMSTCDLTIIGAGPYGLSAAAHLRTIKGLEVRVFGEPMSFWSGNMPAGMFLRSNWTATKIASPNDDLTLEAFQATQRKSFGTPVPIEQFIQYGLWFQRCAVPDLDHRRITKIERGTKGFKITVGDGEVFDSRRVVIAAGIGPFTRRPPEFKSLPSTLVTHTCEHANFASFCGKQVLVVGSGQSSLESAALLHESGAQVEVIGRSHQVHWLQGWASTTLHHRMGKSVRKLLYAPTDVGPAGISQLLARPHLLKCLPRGIQDKLRRRATRPAGARWLVDRLRDVPIALGCTVVSAASIQDRAQVSLSDGRVITAEHIILGTGFQIDISKYDFLSANLIDHIDRVNGFPKLNRDLETSIPSLHIVGAPAAYCFGPLLQFVSGTHFASRTLFRAVSKRQVSASYQ
jgi:FAD-dependent urate hydroxylase